MQVITPVTIVCLNCVCAFIFGYRRRFRSRYKDYYDKLFRNDTVRPYGWVRLSRHRNHKSFVRAIIYVIVILALDALYLYKERGMIFNSNMLKLIGIILCVVASGVLGYFAGRSMCDLLTKKECERFDLEFPDLNEKSSSVSWRFFIIF